NSRRERECKYGLDVRHAIEAIQRYRVDLRLYSGPDQRIDFVRLAKKMTGENFDSTAGGTERLRLGYQSLNATAAQTSWLGVLHQIAILTCCQTRLQACPISA